MALVTTGFEKPRAVFGDMANVLPTHLLDPVQTYMPIVADDFMLFHNLCYSSQRLYTAENQIKYMHMHARKTVNLPYRKMYH